MKNSTSDTIMQPSNRKNLPNTSYLVFNQTALRLRHLSQIIGVNFTTFPNENSLHSNPLPSSSSRPLAQSGYYFTLETTAKERLTYTSDLQPSNCPNWESFDCSTFFPVHLLSLKGIVIRVWLKKANGDVVAITSWGVNFSGLVPVSSKPSSASDYLPNTLLLKLRGSYYTSYDCFKSDSSDEQKNSVELHHGFTFSLSETKPSYSVSSLCRLHSIKRAIKQQERKKENLKETLESRGIKNESYGTNLLKEIENMKIRNCLLMEQLELEMKKLRSIKFATDQQDSANQDKGIELLEGYQSLNRYLGGLKTEEIKLNEENEALKNVVGKIRERRTQLLSHLPLVFPVQKSLEDKPKYCICGVALPDAESYDGVSDQSLSVALGFVAQLLVKIAFLVNIPLKYPITLQGSLSSIADVTSTQLLAAETQFPLYTRGKEREKLHFNYGVFLLNKDIAQLRWSCGLPTSDLRLTLQNVWSFLCSLHDISSPAPRAFMPDTIVPPLVLPASLRQTIQTPTSLLHHHSPRLHLRSSSNLKKSKFGPSDVPSSPKNKFSGKLSLEDDYILGSISDQELKIGGQESDGAQSDIGPSTFSVSSQNGKLSSNGFRNFTENVAQLRSTSFSLDHGLNFINHKENEDFHPKTHLKSNFTNIPTMSSGSFPNLASKGNENSIASSVEESPLSGFHEQTTQVLQSWHENDPSPYSSINITGSGSSEKLGNSKVDILNAHSIEPHPSSDPPPKFKANLGQSQDLGTNSTVTAGSRNEINCVNNKAFAEIGNSVNEKVCPNKENLNLPSEVESLQQRLVSEMGLSLSDFVIDDDPFLDEVASRTANLASQNCSFKLSFSRQSTQE